MVKNFEKGKSYKSLQKLTGSRNIGDICIATDNTTSSQLNYDNITKGNTYFRTSTDKSSWELVSENDNYEIY